MNQTYFLIPLGIAVGLVLAIRRGKIPRGIFKALADIVILLAVILAMMFLMLPLLD